MYTLKEIKKNLHLESVHSELLYLEASSNYTILHFNNGKSEISSYNLLFYEKILEEIASFKRIHRSHIVNMNHVKEVKPDAHLVALSNGTKLKVSLRSKVLVS